MTLGTIGPLAACCIALYVAGLSIRFARAPGWSEQGWFALVALSGGIYSVLDLYSVSPLGGGTILPIQLQVAAAGLHVFGWLRYSGALVNVTPTRWHRLVWGLCLGLAPLGLVPGLIFTGRLVSHRYASFDTIYYDAETTRFGSLAWICFLTGLTLVFIRFARAWRAGKPHAPTLAVATGVLVLAGINDTLVGLEVLFTPYLLSFGFLVPIAAMGLQLTGRFVDEVKALQKLEESLEALIGERTQELIETQKALLQAEKLGALGQLAAGVAHEINNPAAAVTANLRYLIEGAKEGAPPDDGLEALEESLGSMNRIAQVVRQLLITGRLAARYSPERVPVELHEVVEEATRLARARCGNKGTVSNEVPKGLAASAQEQALVQVFANLVSNALEAAAPEREVKVRVFAEALDGKVEVRVEDDGAGMGEETLRHLFEPFFSTKPFGKGTGLGLAVSKGLVAGLGGTLRFTSQLGKGTTAHLTLDRGAPAEEHELAPSSAAQSGPRPRVLLIDDEAGVREALRRELSPRFELSLAAGVREAVGLLEGGGGFDLVLCDLMMPDGGGEAFFAEVERRWPELAAKVVFITGGVTDDRTRAFLDRQAQPVLHKPLDSVRLLELAHAGAH